MFDRYVTFGFNSDGHGEYSDGNIVHVKVPNAESIDEALAEIGNIARAYCEKIVAEGYVMPYPWNWGDVVDEVPDEVFAENGVEFKHVGATEIWYHDEVVVSDE